MAKICCGVAAEDESSPPCKPSSRASRRRRMEIRRFKFVGLVPSPPSTLKKQKVETGSSVAPVLEWVEVHTSPHRCRNADQSCTMEGDKSEMAASDCGDSGVADYPKYGVMSVCGRRREMEDSVSIHPFFSRSHDIPFLHYLAVFDGHGCSHVAAWCKNRLHHLILEELGSGWKETMERSFSRMDEEVTARREGAVPAGCRCELQAPQCDAVGSTAVIAVVSHDTIVIANCGDSRAVLCRDGKPVPLSSDHKPDRADELHRIQSAGGRVIYWDGPRVLGVLAMSRAIGDSYLKPFVSSVPEVVEMERSASDDCLILASDGLWDVVPNETACEIAQMCLRGRGSAAATAVARPGKGGSDKGCAEAALLLTKLALARHSADNISVVVFDLRRDT